MPIGPVQLVVLGFSEPKFRGENLPRPWALLTTRPSSSSSPR